MEQYPRIKEQGIDGTRPETIYAQTKINYTRLVNVLAFELVKERLVTRGGQIRPGELDHGIQADQGRFESMATASNGAECDDISMLRWVLDWGDATPDPSAFQPIDWKKIEKAFKKLCKE